MHHQSIHTRSEEDLQTGTVVQLVKDYKTFPNAILGGVGSEGGACCAAAAVQGHTDIIIERGHDRRRCEREGVLLAACLRMRRCMLDNAQQQLVF